MDGSARQPPPDGGNAPAFAVTGLAAFGPNAPDLGTLRKMLRDGARAIGPHPRYHKSPLYDPRPGVADRCSSFDGAWIGKGAPRPEGRDAGRFDEQTLWALHLAREALAEAASQGRAPGRDARIGLICGAFDWGVSAGNGGLFLRDYLGEVAHPALAGWQGEDIAAKDPRQASRLAQTIGAKLGLTGPCRTMEAACATGLYALALAQLYLRGGKADAMLVVSASSVEAFFASMGFSALQAVPSGGASSLPLDARSGGLALGQGGVGCLIMPARRADAGCHAILRAIGLASDGRGQHLVSPNPKGQKAAIARAYDACGLARGSIDWIEAHATGTKLGDETEMRVLTDEFGAHAPPIGAAKAGLGHWLTASGLLSLVKAVEAFESETVPPTPAIDAPLDERVMRAPWPWRPKPPGAGPRRMAIDSFGFGGTNAHAIVEEPQPNPLKAESDGALGPSGRLRVLGMDAVLGETVGRAELLARGGLPGSDALGNITVDARRLRKSPREIASLSPAAPLIQSVADAALRDADLGEGGRVAVIVAMEADLAVHRLWTRWKIGEKLAGQLDAPALTALQDRFAPATDAAAFLGWIGNLLASRITQAWDFSGPNLTLSSGHHGAAHALELGELMLQAGEADAVVIGAVGLSSAREARALLGERLPCDSAAALVLARDDHPRTPERGAISIDVPASIAALERDAEDLRSGSIARPLVSFVERLAAARFGKRHDAQSPLLPGPGGAIELKDKCGAAYADVTPQPALASGMPRAFVFPVIAGEGSIASALEAFKARVCGSEPQERSLAALSAQSIAALKEAREAAPDAPVIALVARTQKELEKEIERAARHAPEALAQGKEWMSPLGSSATGAPMGDAPVAFLYSGLAALPLGAGADFFAQAPETAAEIGTALGGLEESLPLQRLYPPHGVGPAEAEALSEELAEDTAGLLWVTPIFSCLGARSVEALLGRGPAHAAGHSLGEIGMMLAHGHWRAARSWNTHLAEAPVLQNVLGGERRAIKDQLGVLSAESWTSRLIMAGEEKVRFALEQLPAPLKTQVWISHCNTPKETIISGLGDAVDALCHLVAQESVAGPQGPVIHVPPVAAAQEGLHTLLNGLRAMAAGGGPILHFLAKSEAVLPATVDAAESLKETVIDGFAAKCDAPLLYERLYNAGARIFIEIGPTTGQPRWAKASLGKRPHLALASDKRGAVPGHGLAALAARLLAHRVPIDLERLEKLSFQALSPLTREAKLPVALCVDPYPLVPCEDAAAASPARVEVPQSADRDGALTPPPALAAPGEPAAPPRAQTPAARPSYRAQFKAAHRAFLSQQRRALRDAMARSPNAARSVLYGPAEVRAFADGALEPILGEKGAWLDQLPRRIRLPAPPFMAMDRVIEIVPPVSGLAPARIVTEHDIPHGAGVDIEGQPPYLALDAQGILLLFSHLGFDRMLEGKRVYRWLDAKLTYRGDGPRCGDTVRYEIDMKRIVENGEDLIVFADFRASVAGRVVLEITECAAGFFTDAALEGGQGLKGVAPLRMAVSEPCTRVGRGALDARALRALAEGDIAQVFGAACAPLQTAAPCRLRLPPRKMWMIDRVTDYDLQGGAPGLGFFEAQKYLDPADWYLKAHFVDDPVFAGPCMIEGALQILRIAALAHGLGAGRAAARFEPVAGQPLKVCFRGQVPGTRRSVFTYRLSVTGLGRGPVPWITADVDLVHENRITGRLGGLALQIVEDGEAARWAPEHATRARDLTGSIHELS